MVRTTEEMMDFLWDRRAPNLPPDGLSEVFDRLVWCMDDNGAGIAEVRDKWLAGDDLGKARVALAMDELFPCPTREATVALCERLSARWPELRPECDKLLSDWDRQHASRP